MTAIAIPRRRESGHAVFLAMVFVLISLGFTVGFLRFVMGERMYFMSRYAGARARMLAYSAIAEKASPYAKSPFFVADTTLPEEKIPTMRGGYRDVDVFVRELDMSILDEFVGQGTGHSEYNSFEGKPIEVEYTAEVAYRKQTFAKFMYFTNVEKPGGGPWLGSYVSFGSGEELEGVVFSNDDIRMSQYGCPEFVNDPSTGEESEVYTAGNFLMYNCNESIFEGVFEDSVAKIEWPPFTGHRRVRDQADWIFYGNELIDLTDETDTDRHIMTEIEFASGSFTVKRWRYIIPPIQGNWFQAEFVDTLKRYYPKYYRLATGNNSYFDITDGEMEFQHYDFWEWNPANEFNDFDYIEERTIFADDGVIWIEGGQVRVKGEVDGRFTIATSDSTAYRMHYDNETVNHLQNNIWIVDDLTYWDSYPNGMVREGSPMRLGLLSAANIIIAATPQNGAGLPGNDNNGVDNGFNLNIRINAAMIAMNESFVVHYWRNSTNDYHYLDGMAIKGDGCPWHRLGGNEANDQRGTIHIYGSVIQSRRGYVKRNNPGPYVATIGYEKNYNYDYNFRFYPPPAWPETRSEDGSVNLELHSMGEAGNQ